MPDLAIRLPLPLLAKELTELAVRWRTYAIRVLYATVLICSCWLAFQLSVGPNSRWATNYLGSGALLLWWIGYLQNIGMLLVLPALTCDVFTREKERQTIGLLLMTRLQPATIVIEKFLSRLLPAACLLLISLPTLGFSYSLGGIEAWQIVNTGVGLLTNAILLTAIAVACSSYCHSTTSAFLSTYALASMAPLMVVTSAGQQAPFDFILFGQFFSRAIYLGNSGLSTTLSAGGGGSSGLALMGRYVAYCLPSITCAAFCLLIAKWCLMSRAFKKESRATRWFDAYRGWTGILRRRGVPCDLPPLLSDSALDREPVAWRETRKRWFGPWLPILAGVVSTFISFALFSFRTRPAPGSVTDGVAWSLFLWLSMLLVLITKSASLISRERGQQTLSILLTTPLSGTEIVRQKTAGLKLLVFLFGIPLGVCLILRMLLAMPTMYRLNSGQVPYSLAFPNECTMLLIYPQLAIWMALYFSLRSKTTIAAIMKTVLTIAFLCILPWLILALFAVVFRGLSPDYFFVIMLLLMIGPANLLLYGYGADCIPPGYDASLVPVIANSLIHGGVWLSLRHHCLTNADRLLGRGRRPAASPEFAPD